MNNQKEIIKTYILSQLQGRLSVLGIATNELSADFDLLKSGLLDSMSFVDLVVSLEKQFGLEVDFETAFLKPSFTTLAGLVETISQETE